MYRNNYDVVDVEQRGSSLSNADARSSFVVRVYANLALAVLILAAIVAAIFGVYGPERILLFTQAHVRAMGFGILALCVAGPFVGSAILARNPSRTAQYGLMGFYILLEAAILFPIVAVAALFCGTAIIWQACGLTAALFVALSASVFITRADFSFMRSFLVFSGIAALVVICASFLFSFNLGTWFTVAIIFLMCLYVLYDTSNMLLHADEGDDVLCAVNLFTTILTLFVYILQLLMSLNRDS